MPFREERVISLCIDADKGLGKSEQSKIPRSSRNDTPALSFGGAGTAESPNTLARTANLYSRGLKSPLCISGFVKLNRRQSVFDFFPMRLEPGR